MRFPAVPTSAGWGSRAWFESGCRGCSSCCLSPSLEITAVAAAMGKHPSASSRSSGLLGWLCTPNWLLCGDLYDVASAWGTAGWRVCSSVAPRPHLALQACGVRVPMHPARGLLSHVPPAVHLSWFSPGMAPPFLQCLGEKCENAWEGTLTVLQRCCHKQKVLLRD